jgi:hypothetical protein
VVVYAVDSGTSGNDVYIPGRGIDEITRRTSILESYFKEGLNKLLKILTLMWKIYSI